MLGPCWACLGPSWDPCWAKRSEKWEQQKNTVKRRIFWCLAAYLGAILGLCWPILRAMSAHLGAMLAHLGAMLAHLGAMLAHLGAMLAHVGPCWPISSHKIRKSGKNGTSTKHRKTQGFLAGGSGSPAGGAAVRRGENCRTARTRPGGPWPDIRWPPLPPTHPQVYHRRTKVTVIYGGSCVWGNKNTAIYGVLWPRPKPFFLGEAKKLWLFTWFSGTETLASWRSFNIDARGYRQYSPNIGPKMGQHGVNIGQHRANIGPRQGQHGAKMGPHRPT